MAVFFHHVDLTVSDVAAARPLYDLFLSHAGCSIVTEYPHGGIDWGFGGRFYPSIGLRSAQGDGAGATHSRHAPGLHHLALQARSREDVDELYAKLVAFGAAILDPPAEYDRPDYNGGRGYYAVFFADPDGIKLEYVFTPEIDP